MLGVGMDVDEAGHDEARAAVDRRAGAGLQRERFGGRPVYVMPSTSGLNAHAQLPDLVAHFGAALAAGTHD